MIVAHEGLPVLVGVIYSPEQVDLVRSRFSTPYPSIVHMTLVHWSSFLSILNLKGASMAM